MQDFSGCIANSLDFTESTFRGCRFYKAPSSPAEGVQLDVISIEFL